MSDRVPDKTFELVARQLGTHVSFIEKDWYVTQALKAIANIHNPKFKLVFSGGTALSKAHNLLQRFSEDLDFIIDAHESHTRKSRSNLKNDLLQSLENAGFQIKGEHVRAKNENRFFSIDLEYTTAFSRSQALRPHIQIEMTIKPTQLPPVSLTVSSFVAKISQSQPEVEDILCMRVVENAADKLSALIWRIPDRLRGDSHDDPSVVRHIYDLAVLSEHIANESNFKKLVTNCVKSDAGRIKNKPELANLPIQAKFSELLRCLTTDPEYPVEYDQFVRAVCYSSTNQIPSFDVAVEAIRSLIAKIIR